MRKIVLVSTTILLLSLFTVLQVVEVVNANPLPPSWMASMTINIQSPSNESHNGLPLLVKFSAKSNSVFYLSGTQTHAWTGDFFYVLDGQSMRYSGNKIVNTQMTENSSQKPYYDIHNFSGQAYLTDLTEGTHNITIYWGVGRSIDILYNPSWSATSQFYVDSNSTAQPLSGVDIPASLLPLGAASTLIVIVIVTGILVYFKRRKKNKLTNKQSF
jgi:hypothetical protein